jgi:hypothetical protein
MPSAWTLIEARMAGCVTGAVADPLGGADDSAVVENFQQVIPRSGPAGMRVGPRRPGEITLETRSPTRERQRRRSADTQRTGASEVADTWQTRRQHPSTRNDRTVRLAQTRPGAYERTSSTTPPARIRADRREPWLAAAEFVEPLRPSRALR